MNPLRATFFVPGTPIPKARPRVVRGKRKFPVTYTPKTTAEWEKAIAAEYRKQCPDIFFDRKVPLKFYAELRMPGSGSLATVRGDIDNHCKCLFDALNAVAFSDDAQVIDLHITKRRAHKGERTGVFVHIEPASEVQSALFESELTEKAS